MQDFTPGNIMGLVIVGYWVGRFAYDAAQDTLCFGMRRVTAWAINRKEKRGLIDSWKAEELRDRYGLHPDQDAYRD